MSAPAIWPAEEELPVGPWCDEAAAPSTEATVEIVSVEEPEPGAPPPPQPAGEVKPLLKRDGLSVVALCGAPPPASRPASVAASTPPPAAPRTPPSAAERERPARKEESPAEGARRRRGRRKEDAFSTPPAAAAAAAAAPDTEALASLRTEMQARDAAPRAISRRSRAMLPRL